MSRIYRVTVETNSEAFINVRANSPEQAIAFAKKQQGTNRLEDDPPDYDWPTVKTDIVGDGAFSYDATAAVNVADQLDAGDKRALIRAQKRGRVSIRVNAGRRRKLWNLGLTDSDEALTSNGWSLARASEVEMENDGKAKV